MRWFFDGEVWTACYAAFSSRSFYAICAIACSRYAFVASWRCIARSREVIGRRGIRAIVTLRILVVWHVASRERVVGGWRFRGKP